MKRLRFNQIKRSRLILYVLMVGLLLSLPYILLGSRYWLHIAIIIGVNAVLALSLRILMLTGLLNLALPTFMAFGAYTAAIMLTRFHLPFLLALISGGLVAAVIALILGYPFLRVKGVYFFLITLCFVELFRMTISEHWRNVFGGADGIYDIPAATIGPFAFTSEVSYYYLCLALLVITVAVFWRIERAWIGKVLPSMREADILCQSVGISTLRLKIIAFTIQCFFGGVIGAFFAVYMGGINPNMFGFDMAIYIQIYLIVGGMGSLWGPLIGALLFGGLGDIFRGLGPYQMLIYGITLVMVIKFIPGGLISLPRLVRQAVRESARGKKEQAGIA